MNNLEKLKLLEETVELRRRVLKLDENKENLLLEATACSSEGAGSRTGMDENAFAQDAQVSSQRKRKAEGDSGPLEEGLDSYWKIAGL